MIDTIWNFILGRLEPKGIEIEKVVKQDYKDGKYRFIATDTTGKTQVFSVIRNDEEAILKWYKASHFDRSMDKARKAEVMKENPVEKSAREYYKQEFTIEGISFLFRWS